MIRSPRSASRLSSMVPGMVFTPSMLYQCVSHRCRIHTIYKKNIILSHTLTQCRTPLRRLLACPPLVQQGCSGRPADAAARGARGTPRSPGTMRPRGRGQLPQAAGLKGHGDAADSATAGGPSGGRMERPPCGTARSWWSPMLSPHGKILDRCSSAAPRSAAPGGCQFGAGETVVV